jgi:tRNA uridine 5-carbamoylmethylation protein Kti12
MQKDNLVLFILSGIPGSGKTSWVNKNTEILHDRYQRPVMIISKDLIRERLFFTTNIKDVEKEKKVSEVFYRQLGLASSFKNAVIIIDNTHCTESHIDRYFQIFKNLHMPEKMVIYVKFFNTPFWKAHFRNIVRKWKIGKWISWKDMLTYRKRFKAIDQKKYEHLFPHDL